MTTTTETTTTTEVHVYAHHVGTPANHIDTLDHADQLAAFVEGIAAGMEWTFTETAEGEPAVITDDGDLIWYTTAAS